MKAPDLTPALRDLLAPLVEELLEQRLATLAAEGRIAILGPDAATADLDKRFGVRPALTAKGGR